MDKPTKYPRKLRKTLEKVAAGRDEREAASAWQERPGPLVSFWHTYLDARKVDVMVGSIEHWER